MAQESSGGSNQTIILVVGAEGTAEYGEQFAEWAKQWTTVASIANAACIQIGLGDSETNDHEQLKQTIATADHEADQPLWIVLIGHGTYARQSAKFNLRGPDVSAKELARWLEPVRRPTVIVNCASSSAPFINALSGKGRVVVTATKTGAQYNFARFGGHFATAIASPDSDLDHDDEVSVHEAFVRSSAAVKDFYASADRIQTEHALLDDNGDSKGTPASMFRGARPIAKAKEGDLDGKRAAKISLSPSGKQLPFTGDELRQRDELETQLEAIRSRRHELSDSEFDQRIEPILIQLARIYSKAESRDDVQRSGKR